MAGESITKPTTVELFIKARAAGMRVEVDAITTFITALDGLAGDVVTKATALATTEQRTTLLARDITDGFKAVVGTPGQQVDPAAVFHQLDTLDTDQLAGVINLIQAWLDARKKP